MDSHGQIGPFKGDYQEDLATLAQGLGLGALRVELSERMTRYKLVLVLADRLQHYGGQAPPYLRGLAPERWVYVSREGRDGGAAWIQLGPAIDPGYLQGAMGLPYLGDAEVIAEFLTALAPHVERATAEASA